MKLNHYMAFLRVAVDENEDGRITGNVYSQRLKEPIHFSGTEDLLLRIDDLLDRQDFPRAFQKKRSFADSAAKVAHTASTDEEDGEEPENMDEETVNQATGKAATFALNVITRQNTSWQGYLDWLDGSSKIAFNSDLELVEMIMARLHI